MDSESDDNKTEEASSNSEAESAPTCQLDLGLEELLKQAEAELRSQEDVTAVANEGTHEEPPGGDSSAIDAQDESAGVKVDPLAPLAALEVEGKWGPLADAADRLLGDQDCGAAAGVYWCWAESKLKRLSASILAAPLISALEQARNLSDSQRLLLGRAASDIAIGLFREQEFSLVDAVLVQLQQQGFEFTSEKELRQLLDSRRAEVAMESDELERLRGLEARLPSAKENAAPESSVELRPSASQSLQETPEQVQGPSRRQVVAWIVVILLLIFATDYYRRRVTSEPEALVIAMLDPPAPALTDLSTQFIPEKIERFNSLDALLLELEPMSSTGPSSASASSTPSASVSAAPRRTKEKVNTEGPLEPPLSELSGHGTIVGVPVPGGNSPNVGAVPSVPPIAGERLMWLLADTDVLERPSYAAPAVGSLKRGDRIKVDARVGDWLRLRNKDGKVGFILAQDASEQGPR